MAGKRNPVQPQREEPSQRGGTLAYRQAMGELPRSVRRTPGDAFDAARNRIRAGDKLDMGVLAEQLGIARATLYRWAGDRDQLLADVVTAEMQDLIRGATARAQGTGVERLESSVGRFLEMLSSLPALRAFLVNEGDGGLHMVTSPTGPIRPRLVETVVELIQREQRSGQYRPPARPELLADGIVAIAERFLHNAGEATLEPDPATARSLAGLLLREPCR